MHYPDSSEPLLLTYAIIIKISRLGSKIIFTITSEHEMWKFSGCHHLCFIVSCVSHVFTSVHCCLVVICWERADQLALVGDVYCIFATFPCGILGQVWYLVVLFPDLSVFLTLY